MAVTTSPLTGCPSKAPLRSTRCRRRQPPSTHLAAMLTGSSESTVESSMRPWRRRTQAPSFRSIAGIISISKSSSLPARFSRERAQPPTATGLAAVPADEILQQLQPVDMALLRVELHGELRAFGQRRGEVLAVVTSADHLRRVAGLDVVAVHEVEAAHVRNLVPQRMVSHLPDFVPAHVRHLQMLAILDQILAEEAHLTGKQADAIDPAVLLAALKQRLHAHADAEERPVGADL